MTRDLFLNKYSVEYFKHFMRKAEQEALKGTCLRKQVGMVLVNTYQDVISSGYNTSLSLSDRRRLPTCRDVGCLLVNDHCERTVHAEALGIARAVRYGLSTEDSAVYVTASPCWNCFKLLASAGVSFIVYKEFYREPRIVEASEALEIHLVDLTELSKGNPL